MITSIRLQNFKCFEDQTVRLAPITILSGINGTGKSSVLQSLLLLRQSYVFGVLQKTGALLNGPLVSLGTADDAFYENMATGGALSLSLTSDNGGSANWTFSHEAGRETLPLRKNHEDVKKDFFIESLFNENFHYLQAERIGPRTSFLMSNHDARKYNQIGNSGEYCAHFLAQRERQKISVPALLHPDVSIPELRQQTEAWLAEISYSARIHVSEHHEMDLVNLAFSFVNNGLPSRNFRPTNVGFGITYSLPIFVSVLASSEGSLLIVENPEAHLHPKGQAAMGRFLALAAANGMQVIVETHSDHFLNGLRVAVKKGIIKSDKVAIHFFDRDPKSPHSKVVSPNIDSHGRIDQWPEGFFDEWEKMLAELL
jgi:predicted ATPase